MIKVVKIGLFDPRKHNVFLAFSPLLIDFISSLFSDILLGVHCSNGVNRSGYLICRYLIDSLGWNSHEAIAAFESARGYTIERGAFVQAIHRAAKERRLKK